MTGKSKYRHFFTGEAKPQTLAQHGIGIRYQYSEGYGRRVIDNFEQGPWALNTLGGGVTKESTMSVIKEGTAWDVDPTVPHDTDALLFEWSPPGLVPWLCWSVPDGMTSQGARWRDVEGTGPGR